ncbi:hypothetical protein T458_23975 [Brevibacillus panacihumi W25]|uniref:DUF2642 domain-containing protein n=1 Tax=Brevibacillus panacihumi W25 TaxID=1408254 RepID=V6M823_9BACL|nr:hypothetical protein [Brevibacillus panacihumi]EST51503.1 hypothetical protein T458_23975 [Brevibacillus panacihumi W25]
MKLIIHEQEIKAYFEGLRQLIWGGSGKPKPPVEEPPCPPEKSEFRKVLLGYLHQSIEIATDAGSLAGVLREVGDDYVEINEPGGTQVIVPLVQINYVQAL